MSSSQLTNSYFSEGWLNHQPENLPPQTVTAPDVYGFDVVDPLRLLQQALKQPPMPEEIPEEVPREL